MKQANSMLAVITNGIWNKTAAIIYGETILGILYIVLVTTPEKVYCRALKGAEKRNQNDERAKVTVL